MSCKKCQILFFIKRFGLKKCKCHHFISNLLWKIIIFRYALHIILEIILEIIEVCSFYTSCRQKHINFNQKAKFTLDFSRGEFGFFSCVPQIRTNKSLCVGCRSPPFAIQTHRFKSRKENIQWMENIRKDGKINITHISW